MRAKAPPSEGTHSDTTGVCVGTLSAKNGDTLSNQVLFCTASTISTTHNVKYPQRRKTYHRIWYIIVRCSLVLYPS